MSGLLGKKGQSTTDKRLNSIQVTRAAYGDPVPLVYGKTRLAGSLIWYGAFTATPHTQKQGGKGGGHSSSTSYTYSAAIALSLCEGPITSISQSYVDKGLDASLANQNLTLFLGAGGQATWSYLSTNAPSQAVPYDHTAYVASGAYNMGTSAALPNMSFETVALLSDATYSGDAPPAAVVSDYCTEANHGAAFPYLSTLTGANSFDAYCYAMGFFLSPAELTQRSASDFLGELLQITNSAPVWKAGTLAVIPYGDTVVTGNGVTYTPGNGGGGGISTPLYSFTDDDYVDGGGDLVVVTRKPGSQVFNRVRVEYLNRNNQYNVDVAEATDAQDIALNGERTAQTYTFHSITSASMARMVAQLILNRGLYYRNQYRFKLRADYSLLEPMDVVAITDSTLGVSALLCRVVEISDGADDELELTVEELPIGPGHAPQYAWSGAAGFAANTLASPGSVSTPAIFTMPPLLVSGNGGYEIGIAVAGTGALWGGCDVYQSYDNTTFFQVGTVTGPSRYGTLRASFASNLTDPDTTGSLQLQLVDTDLAVAAVSQTAVDNLRSLMYVDGEILGYRDASLVGTGQYNLGYFHRGKYGSAISTHASGSQWAMLDQSLFRVSFDPGMAGKTAYFKFVSFNVYGSGYESLATVSSYSRVLGTGAQPISAGFSASATNVSQIGNSYLKTGGTTATWGDAQIYSNEGYAGGAYCSAQAYDTNGSTMVGLNTDPVTDGSYGSIDFAWYFDTVGVLRIYENGALIGTYGTYTSSTVCSIAWDGASVVYYKDGTAQRTVAATPARLYLDTAFYTVGGGVKNLAFGPAGSKGSNGTNGQNGITAQLTVPAVSLPADSAGTVSSYATATGTLKVYSGTTDVTASSTFAVGTNANSLTATINASGVYAVTAGLSVDLASVTFNATYGGITIPCTFALTKSKAGTNGTNGTNGINGLNTAIVYAYQRAASAPALPSVTTTYTFATASLTGLNNGWTSTIPAGTSPLYVTVASASATGTTDTIAAGEWATAVVLTQNGADGTNGTSGTNGTNGTNGANGLNVATIYIYQRAASAPALPSVTTTYTFATTALTGLNNGWAVTIPTGTDPVYVSTATAAATGTTDTIGSGEWAAVAVLAQNGTNGTNGSNGTNGTNGTNGAAGTRGSKQFYATGSSWLDATADAAITAASLTKVTLDSVTISNGSSFAATKYWDGSAWQTVTASIDGNLLVAGTVAAAKIDSRGLSIKDGSGNVILAAGSPLAASNITPAAGWLNTGVSISSSGALSGAGGGTVTIGGLGYSGDLKATNDLRMVLATGYSQVGNQVVKGTGSAAWDTSAYTVNSYTGGAFIECRHEGNHWMAGLNSDPSTALSYSTIDFAFHGAYGNAYGYTNGTAVWGPVTIAAGAQCAVTYDGSVVRWLIDGVVAFSQTVGANLKLFGQVSLYYVGENANYLRVGPYGNPSAVQPSNPINSGNVSTYIAAAAIGDAYISNLSASKITATSLSAISANLGTVTAGTVIFDNGSYMKVIGMAFGVSSDLIEWYGPHLSSIASCTKANAISYTGIDGSSYFGGLVKKISTWSALSGYVNVIETVPPGASQVKIQVWGGGGGGAARNAGTDGGGGGGGYCELIIGVAPGNMFTVNVGATAAGGNYVSAGVNGTAGKTSSVAGTVSGGSVSMSALGGGAGIGTVTGGAGGAGGTASGGSTNTSGSAGTNGAPGAGGASGGGSGNAYAGAGNVANGPGGGGNADVSGGTAQTGAPGQVQFTYS